MPNVFATKSGLWSDTTVWNTGALPTAVDDVFANNFTVYININSQVLSIQTNAATGITAGGSFIINNGVSLSANIFAGSTNCLTFLSAAPSTCSIFGNIFGSTTTASRHGIVHNSSGTMFIYGNAIGGTTSFAYGIQNNTSGVVNMFGNLSGGSGFVTTRTCLGAQNAGIGIFNLVGNVTGGFPPASDLNHGIENASTGIVNITGNAIGGNLTNLTQPGVNNTGAGTINILGNAIGGLNGAACNGVRNSSTGTVNIIRDSIGNDIGTGVAGAFNVSTGRIFIYGRAIAGNQGIGAINNSTGLLYVRRAVGNSFGLGSVGAASVVGASNTQNGLMYVEEAQFGPRGQSPITGPVYIVPAINNTIVTVTTAAGTTNTFYTSLSVSNLLPPVSSVRSGVVYNAGASVGTMTIPSVSAVQAGVPIDNTVGIATLTPADVWNLPLSASLNANTFGDRTKNAATIQTVGNLIASYNT